MNNSTDSLTIALFIAATLHALVLLGVSFDPFVSKMHTPPTLEVVLIQQSNNDEVEDANYLAQSNQDGGGNTERDTRPTSPFSSALDAPTDGLAATPVTAGAPRPQDAAQEAVITAVFAEDAVNTSDEREKPKKPDQPEATTEVSENTEIARLAAEIDRQLEEFAKRPRKKHISARTRESASAEYMRRWINKVERIGNLNYPDRARREELSGELILIVGIHKNGDLESIMVDKSSGHSILDNAARTIVEMAAPFEPLTGKLAEETDILYIIRTWEFTKQNSLGSH